jgi:hypothetical protein
MQEKLFVLWWPHAHVDPWLEKKNADLSRLNSLGVYSGKTIETMEPIKNRPDLVAIRQIAHEVLKSMADAFPEFSLEGYMSAYEDDACCDILTDRYREDGRKLVYCLDKEAKGFKITAALWYYLSETGEWRFFIATPYLQKKGAIASYKLIRSVMTKSLPNLSFSIESISILKSTDPLINLIKTVTKHSRDITLHNINSNGYLIRDAYIYCIE